MRTEEPGHRGVALSTSPAHGLTVVAQAGDSDPPNGFSRSQLPCDSVTPFLGISPYAKRAMRPLRPRRTEELRT